MQQFNTDANIIVLATQQVETITVTVIITVTVGLLWGGVNKLQIAVEK